MQSFQSIGKTNFLAEEQRTFRIVIVDPDVNGT